MNWIRLGWGTFLNKSVMATVDYIVVLKAKKYQKQFPEWKLLNQKAHCWNICVFICNCAWDRVGR